MHSAGIVNSSQVRSGPRPELFFSCQEICGCIAISCCFRLTSERSHSRGAQIVPWGPIAIWLCLVEMNVCPPHVPSAAYGGFQHERLARGRLADCAICAEFTMLERCQGRECIISLRTWELVQLRWSVSISSHEAGRTAKLRGRAAVVGPWIRELWPQGARAKLESGIGRRGCSIVWTVMFLFSCWLVFYLGQCLAH